MFLVCKDLTPDWKAGNFFNAVFSLLGAFSSFCSLSSPSGIFRYLLFTLCSELIVICERLGLIGVLRRSLLSLFIHSFTQSTTDARLGLTLCQLCKALTKREMWYPLSLSLNSNRRRKVNTNKIIIDYDKYYREKKLGVITELIVWGMAFRVVKEGHLWGDNI